MVNSGTMYTGSCVLRMRFIRSVFHLLLHLDAGTHSDAVVSTGPDLVFWYPIAALALGLVLSSLAYHTFDKRSHPGRIALCFVGFLVAMVWILTIVNEVVGVLQVSSFPVHHAPLN